MKKTVSKLLAFCAALVLLALPLASCSQPSETPATTTAPSLKPTPIITAGPSPTPLPTATPTEQPTPSPTPLPPTAEPTPTLDPDGPQVLQLYFRSTRKLATEYDANLVKGEKNVEFFALPTDKESVEKAAPRSLVEKYWGKYRKEGYRIGYAVDITLKSGELIHLNIRRPGDAPPIDREPKYFAKFVEIYLYDSARKDPDGDYGTWHLQKRLLKEGESVLITNIKFHAGSRYAEVDSIDLTAYAYQGDDCFDGNGEYTGSLKYHVTISRQ